MLYLGIVILNIKYDRSAKVRFCSTNHHQIELRWNKGEIDMVQKHISIIIVYYTKVESAYVSQIKYLIRLYTSGLRPLGHEILE